MTTYKEINGTAVQNYAGDLPGAVDGQLWYNSTATNVKFQYAATTDAWSTGGNLNTARRNMGGAGIKTAALAFGGNVAPQAQTEAYNGSAWTEVNDLNTGRPQIRGTGGDDNTSVLAWGGDNAGEVALTELWNGTNWTEVNDLNTARQ